MTGKQKKPFVPTAEMREVERRQKEREAIFAAVPDCPAKQALRLAILEAAFWLLEDHGEKATKQSDVLMEFMSREDANRTWEQFFETDKPFDPTEFKTPAYVFVCQACGVPRCNGPVRKEDTMGSRPGFRSKDFRRSKIYAKRKRSKIHSSSYR